MKSDRNLLTYLLCLLVLVGLTSCGKPGETDITGPTLHILFLGNSYTSVNNLPEVFTQLARSGGHGTAVESATQGGWQLRQHAADASSLALLNKQKWDVVVLQEQSTTPASPEAKSQIMYPAVTELNEKIKALGAKPMLYMTWGRQKGLPDMGYSDYSSMQDAITSAYMGIADQLTIPVAPVGAAWKVALAEDPSLDLWQGDGSHPTLFGTYLAACVFYCAIYGESPAGLHYQAGLPDEKALLLQKAAAETVLTRLSDWHLAPKPNS